MSETAHSITPVITEDLPQDPQLSLGFMPDVHWCLTPRIFQGRNQPLTKAQTTVLAILPEYPGETPTRIKMLSKVDHAWHVLNQLRKVNRVGKLVESRTVRYFKV